LTQQSTGKHVAPRGHILIQIQPVFVHSP